MKVIKKLKSNKKIKGGTITDELYKRVMSEMYYIHQPYLVEQFHRNILTETINKLKIDFSNMIITINIDRKYVINYDLDNLKMANYKNESIFYGKFCFFHLLFLLLNDLMIILLNMIRELNQHNQAENYDEKINLLETHFNQVKDLHIQYKDMEITDTNLPNFLAAINTKITTLKELLTSLNQNNQQLEHPALINIKSSFNITETYLNKIIAKINESSTTSTSTGSLGNIMEIIALNPTNGLRNT
jgi:hypothetical protein